MPFHLAPDSLGEGLQSSARPALFAKFTSVRCKQKYHMCVTSERSDEERETRQDPLIFRLSD